MLSFTKMPRTLSVLLTSCVLLVTAFQVSADDLANLDNKAKAEQVSENAHNQKRVILSAERARPINHAA